MKPYLLVSGDFVRTGGMDRANYVLAHYLAQHGNEVHLVAHRLAEDLSSRPNVIVHRVPKPLHSYLVASPLLDRVGRYWAKRIAARGGRVLVNGGNCRWGDINWVHYVHAVYKPHISGSMLRRLRNHIAHSRYLRDETSTLRRARVIVANSERTKADIIERLNISEARIHTVYYGIDPQHFKPASTAERLAIRKALGWGESKPVVAFIGALGDRRKGFNTLFQAWKILCADPQWSADLAVIGTGGELAAWRLCAESAGLKSRIHFLGFRSDVPVILAACDALVSPTRYEAYGLGVQEALSCGLPAVVTRTAGVAERYTDDLQGLLISDPTNVADLVERLRIWRNRAEYYHRVVDRLSQRLRMFRWDDMAARIMDIIEKSE